MIYLYGYLGVGLVVLVLVYGTHLFSQLSLSDSDRSLRDAFRPRARTHWHRFLIHVFVPVGTAVLVVLAWPIAIVMQIKSSRQKKTPDLLDPEVIPFAVAPEHLEERFTLEELEARETVTDPLGAVPPLPFGFLNAAWKRFLENHSEGHELWSFSATTKTFMGTDWFRAGYVLVRDGKPGAFFLLKEL